MCLLSSAARPGIMAMFILEFIVADVCATQLMEDQLHDGLPLLSFGRGHFARVRQRLIC